MTEKIIECPNCGEEAMLMCDPHKYAGIWECEHCETSDVHDHTDTETIEDEVDTMRNGEHDTYKVKYEVCTECGVEVEP